MPNLLGQSIGQYHIIEQLGEGGMATVYKAYDTRLDCDVAIKFIRRDAVPAEMHQQMFLRFEREAKEMAKLSYPNIVHIRNYGEYEGSPYLVMEYIRGGTLKAKTGKAMPYAEAARILAPIARALEYAHERGLIHRDVKPANILLSERGIPMLSDFGIAKILESEPGQTLTGTGMGVGTPEYMAPEQWLGKACEASDIYSLGIVFFELITGCRPYKADTPNAIMLRHFSDPLPRPRQFKADLPEKVEQVVFTALAKDTGSRYGSMSEFAEALEKLGRIEDERRIREEAEERIKREMEVKIRAEMEEKYRQKANDGASQVRVVSSSVTTSASPRRESTPVPAASSVSIDEGQGTQREDRLKSGVISPAPSKRVSRRNLPVWMWVMGGLLAVGVCMVSMGGLAAGLNGMGPLAFLAQSTRQITGETSNSDPSFDSSLAPDAGTTMVSEKDSMILVYVPEGEFLMGSASSDSDANSDEKPQHTTYLDAFWIDRTEVTNAKYAKCVADGACNPPYNSSSYTRASYYGNSQYVDYPVIYVDWHMASAYCSWAGRRLPSEAEWEKAARGIAGRLYPWGDQAPTSSVVNFGSNVGDTTEVGSYSSGASPYGALDMAGNVWEWVNDWYDENFYGNSPTENPLGPSSRSYRGLRGGSWSDGSRGVRSAIRGWYSPEVRNYSFGFRCALSTAP
jgi:eukaryotic-like serine/threonine-protein kinase